MIDENWLTSYQHLSGIENALKRIDDRISLVYALAILEQEYSNFEQDFCSFFPELQRHMKDYDFLIQNST
jgi:acyl carrier protein phosphodiesterase